MVHWLTIAMGASLWNQLGLPLLIGVASAAVFAALCFLSVRLWNCFIMQLSPQTAAEESSHDRPLPDGDAVAHANAMRDLETGNGYGPAEGGQSMTEPELELGIVNGGEARKAQVTRVAARGALVRPVEMDVPHSQQEEIYE